MNLPTIKQLRYFLALTEETHFGHAAERCFVSQSAFSSAIRELEDTLGVQLVNRTNRKVTITPLGREVAEKAADIIRQTETLVESVQGTREPLTGELRLGVIPTVAPFLLPTVSPRLRRAYPELKLFLTEAQTAVLHDKLMSGDIDVALLALPFDLPGTETMTLFRDRFLLAYNEKTQRVNPDHYRFSQLPDRSVMLMEDGHCLRDHALDACKLRGTNKISRFSANSLLSLIEMVNADLAVSFLPELATGSALLKNTRVRLKPLGERNARTIGLAWHKGSSREAEFRMLGEFIIEHRSPK